MQSYENSHTIAEVQPMKYLYIVLCTTVGDAVSTILLLDTIHSRVCLYASTEVEKCHGSTVSNSLKLSMQNIFISSS